MSRKDHEADRARLRVARRTQLSKRIAATRKTLAQIADKFEALSKHLRRNPQSLVKQDHSNSGDFQKLTAERALQLCLELDASLEEIEKIET